MLANDPAFKNLNSVGWWGTHAADEEIARWSFKLMLHYAIKGNKDMLSKRYGYKYHPGHLKNCDFENGLAHWKTNGKVKAGKFANYASRSQNRYGSIYDVGNTFAVLSREGKNVSEVRQTAKGLKVGQLYSLSFLVADYNDIIKGINNPRRLPMGVQIDGGSIIKEKSYNYVHHRYKARYKGVGRVNAYRIVFKAQQKDVDIVFNNNESEDGQQLALNYICLHPYFAEEKYK